MVAQIADQIKDTPGWGAAEWVAVLTAITLVVGSVTTLVIQLVRLRAENSNQHAEGRALISDVGTRLVNLHEAVDRVDVKIDAVSERLDDHMVADRHVRRGNGWWDR